MCNLIRKLRERIFIYLVTLKMFLLPVKFNKNGCYPNVPNNYKSHNKSSERPLQLSPKYNNYTPYTHDYHHITSAIKHQHKIGWKSFLKELISQE